MGERAIRQFEPFHLIGGVQQQDARAGCVSQLFECGAEPLDRYLRVQAGQDARKNISAPFVLVLADGTVAGIYTSSASAEQPQHTSARMKSWR